MQWRMEGLKVVAVSNADTVAAGLGDAGPNAQQPAVSAAADRACGPSSSHDGNSANGRTNPAEAVRAATVAAEIARGELAYLER